MSRFDWSLVVWGAWLLLFLGLELSAVFGLSPWQTLSSTAWRAETLVRLLRWVFLVGLAVLMVHIVARWP